MEPGMGMKLVSLTEEGRNAIRAFIGEGKEIPDGSMVLGMPGKVVRPLSAEEIARIQRISAHYVQNWQRYRIELKADES